MKDHASKCTAGLIGLLLATGIASAGDDTRIPDDYAAPAQRVTLADGRTLNLRCEGKGPRVVLLEAGANADSSTWFRVMPRVRDDARVCAYDRAGYGFSDEGPAPRGVDADVADLHALVRAAKLHTPLVLVGHSLGSNIVRRYAQQFPADVVGLVLVDPPDQGAEPSMPEQWKRDDEASRARRDAFLSMCSQAAATGGFEAPPASGCLRAPPPWMGERVAASVRTNKARPGYWRTLRSELDENQRTFASPVPEQERYGELPLVLLRAEASDAGMAPDVGAVMRQAREQTHSRILAGTSRSRVVDVAETSHDIQLDQPAAVAAAVKDVLSMSAAAPAAKTGR